MSLIKRFLRSSRTKEISHQTELNVPVRKQIEQFHGVSLSELNMLAKQVYHGKWCSIDRWGFLVFFYDSKRGHKNCQCQMGVNQDGKLYILAHTDSRYEGQWRTSADDFVNLANEHFSFLIS